MGRGYLRREALTAERFLADPFVPGGRMYRTGDFGRWRADGQLEFLGRADDQIKLRGLRIELGDIEAALSQHPDVQASAVTVKGASQQAGQLVGYVVAPGLDVQTLRHWMQECLPRYMVPALFIRMDALPRLPNGKIDRRALPDPDRSAQTELAVPRSPVEASLLDIWKNVLRTSRIGIHDDFFTLGGHSLNATQVISQMRAVLGVDVPIPVFFESATIADLGREVEARLSAPVDASDEGVPRRAGTTGLPVAFSQRRMWLIHQVDPQGSAYNIRQALRLRGPLDHSAMQRALGDLVARHDAFRTRFTFVQAEPVADVDPHGKALIEDVAMPAASGRPEQDEAALLAALAARAAEPFDLVRGPLHRFLLGRLADDDHVLLMVMHHIVGDDWSFAVLAGEFNRLYLAYADGVQPELPPLPIRFVDYAAWQREHVAGALLEGQLHYWLDRLDGMSPLNLPVDKGVTQRMGSHGARVRVPLDDAWLARLQTFGARHGATPFMTLAAAFVSLLGRWCGQDDVCVGFPIAGRTRHDAETLVGSLVNTLILRAAVDARQPFSAFLQREVREALLGAFAHQDLPYDYLIERLRATGRAGRTPEIRVLFNVLNSPRQPLAFGPLDASYVALPWHATQFDLSMTISTEGLKALVVDYSTELFDEATMTALTEVYLQGLERAMEHPESELASLWFASDADLARLKSWNGTAADLPATATIPELLAVHRHRTDPAVRDADDHVLSYQMLWQEVERLAGVLRRRGVGRGRRVGLGLHRGVHLSVAQLAVLRSGAAYVPLDPEFPRQRLEGMIEDAGLSVIVTERAAQEVWNGLPVPSLLLVDDAPDEADAGVPLLPDTAMDAGPEDAAYLIYTSGSTGKPKGVAVPHRAVVNFLMSMAREPGMTPDDIILAVTTLNFDIAVLELLLPLYVGAQVCIASRDEAIDAALLQARLRSSGATLMQATPATWQMLLAAGWAGGATFRALVGGEPLSAELARALGARCGAVWNLYGPTETTVWSTCWRVPADPQWISIGQPIANTQVHVLDDYGRSCPVGFSGEIHIGGAGVAIGYHQRPELNRERFLPDVFADVPGLRMYRTGDRGRWRHGGLLEHQGRLDFQIKLRGYRIEPGEIESRLLREPGVAEAWVLLREDAPGDLRLVASQVRRFLAAISVRSPVMARP